MKSEIPTDTPLEVEIGDLEWIRPSRAMGRAALAAVRRGELGPRLALVLALTFTLPAWAGDRISGVVRSVYDGDTLTLESVDQGIVKVRLEGIDAPELAQPHGKAARDALRDLVLASEVQVLVLDADRYGRAVGLVRAGTLDVNAELVRLGHAWAYLDYQPRPVLLDLETLARSQARGLWAERPQPPWAYRREVRARQAAERESKP